MLRSPAGGLTDAGRRPYRDCGRFDRQQGRSLDGQLDCGCTRVVFAPQAFPAEGTDLVMFYGSVVLADLDNNGAGEIVAAGTDGNVSVWKTDGTYFPPNWPRTPPLPIFSSPAAADLDWNGGMSMRQYESHEGQCQVSSSTEARNLKQFGQHGSLCAWSALLRGGFRPPLCVARITLHHFAFIIRFPCGSS